MKELPSIKITNILPTGEFCADEYVLKSVALEEIAKKDAEITRLRVTLTYIRDELIGSECTCYEEKETHFLLPCVYHVVVDALEVK